MKPRMRLKLYQDKEGDLKTRHYHIGFDITSDKFGIHFMSPEQFTLSEANFRIIRLAAEMDAETDGIIIANKPLNHERAKPALYM